MNTKPKHLARYVAIAAVAIAGAFGLAACGGGDGERASAPVPAEPAPDGGQAGGAVLAGDVLEADDFIGMPLDVASAWAEENGRQWRVGREDGVDLAVTADLVPDRVTFTVEAGVVTAVSIEEADR